MSTTPGWQGLGGGGQQGAGGFTGFPQVQVAVMWIWHAVWHSHVH
jgi:hypothetical protein